LPAGVIRDLLIFLNDTTMKHITPIMALPVRNKRVIKEGKIEGG
jgi:hypothetical protein